MKKIGIFLAEVLVMAVCYGVVYWILEIVLGAHYLTLGELAFQSIGFAIIYCLLMKLVKRIKKQKS